MTKSSFHLIYAPPGHGKTTGLLTLFRELEVGLVFLSPLRAIAEEVFKRAQAQGLEVQWRALNAPKQKTFVVSTFESFKPELFDPKRFIFVIDEVHLIYYWGEDFRPRLFESFYDLAELGGVVMGLTASLAPTLYPRFKADIMMGFDEFHLYDLGGGELLFRPKFSWGLTLLSVAEQLMMIALTLKFYRGRALIFCRTRAEVAWVSEFLERRHLRVASCLGGEVEQFLAQCHTQGEPQVIVATTVLSHGVNLGAIRLVCFLSQVDKSDFYLQMCARGGRDGGGFVVVHRQHRRLTSLGPELLILPFIKLLSWATL